MRGDRSPHLSDINQRSELFPSCLITSVGGCVPRVIPTEQFHLSSLSIRLIVPIMKSEAHGWLTRILGWHVMFQRISTLKSHSNRIQTGQPSMPVERRFMTTSCVQLRTTGSTVMSRLLTKLYMHSLTNMREYGSSKSSTTAASSMTGVTSSSA